VLRGTVAAIAAIPVVISFVDRIERRPDRLADCPGLPLALDLLARYCGGGNRWRPR